MLLLMTYQMILILLEIYQICSIVALILGIWIAVRKRKNTTAEEPNVASLTFAEKWVIFVLCFFNPIILGVIFYYGWKKRLPQQAKAANWLSIIAFVIVSILFLWLFLFYVPNNVDSFFSEALSPNYSPALRASGIFASNGPAVFTTDFPTITISATSTSASWKSLPPDDGITFRYPPQMGGAPFGGFLYSCQQSDGTITTDQESPPFPGDGGSLCDGVESFIQTSVMDGLLETSTIPTYYAILPDEIEKVSIQKNGVSRIFYIGADSEGSANPNVWVVDTEVGNQAVQLTFGGNGFFSNQTSSSVGIVITRSELDTILPIISTLMQANQSSTSQ
jgi:hypothetical protein